MHSRFYAYSVIDVDNTGGIIGQSFTLTVTDIDGRTNTTEVTLEASLTLGLPAEGECGDGVRCACAFGGCWSIVGRGA